MTDGVLHAVAGTLFQYDEGNGQYRTHGSVGCALLGDVHSHTYQLVCYVDSTQYICTARVTSKNETSLQYHSQASGPCYSTFRDDKGILWSIHFATEDECITFGANVALAMYAAAGLPTHSAITADLTPGKQDSAPIRAHNHIRGRYTVWMVQKSNDQVPKLGPILDSVSSTDTLYQFMVPSANASPNAMSESIGFEPYVAGMYREGKRFCIIPATCRRPGGIGGNQATLCFMVEVCKVKVDTSDAARPVEHQGSAVTSGEDKKKQGNIMFEQFLEFQKMQQAAQPQLQLTNNMGGNIPHVSQPPLQAQQQPLQAQQQPLQAYGMMPNMLPAAPTNLSYGAPAIPQPVSTPALSHDCIEKIDRVNSSVGTALTMLRDLTEKYEIFAHDWKVASNKAKPSTLSNAQLEHSVRTMIEDNDRLKEELHQRSDLILSLEARIKDLQLKYDKLATSATTLMDEKKAAVHSSSEMRLELDRQMLKVQESLSRVTSERDDLQRHVSTVKKLLEISDTDLREAKGKVEVATIQLQSNATKLSSLEDQLNEERARRKALESRVLALTDQVRELTDEMRQKDIQLEERRRKLESDRQHFTDLIEEDRRRSETEIAEIRQEMMRDLQSRERRFQEDKVRVSEESYVRGCETGRDEATKEARKVYEARLAEVQLDLQRTRNELESQQLCLRTSEERANREMKDLLEQMKAVQDTLNKQTERCARLEMQVERQKDFVPPQTIRHEKEKLYSALTDIALQIQNPIPPENFRTLISELFTGKVVNLSFDRPSQRTLHEVAASTQASEKPASILPTQSPPSHAVEYGSYPDREPKTLSDLTYSRASTPGIGSGELVNEPSDDDGKSGQEARPNPPHTFSPTYADVNVEELGNGSISEEEECGLVTDAGMHPKQQEDASTPPPSPGDARGNVEQPATHEATTVESADCTADGEAPGSHENTVEKCKQDSDMGEHAHHPDAADEEAGQHTHSKEDSNEETAGVEGEPLPDKRDTTADEDEDEDLVVDEDVAVRDYEHVKAVDGGDVKASDAKNATETRAALPNQKTATLFSSSDDDDEGDAAPPARKGAALRAPTRAPPHISDSEEEPTPAKPTHSHAPKLAPPPSRHFMSSDDEDDEDVAPVQPRKIPVKAPSKFNHVFEDSD